METNLKRGNVNRNTKHKGQRTRIDLIYEICKICINKSYKYRCYCHINCNHDTFDKGFNQAVDNNLLEIIDEKNNEGIKHYYIITKKGREYIIAYEKMENYIAKLNMMIKENNEEIKQEQKL